MKKILLPVLALIIVIGVSLCMFFFSTEKLTPENAAGKTVYYTKISGAGAQDGERYDYELTTYDEKGKEKKLAFSAGKQLREGAYVQLYHTLLRGVTYWEEVDFEELPKTVQQKYQK